MKSKAVKISVLLLFVLIFFGCAQKIPKDALQLSPQSLQDRQLQTRRFSTTDEAMILTASAAVLQDIGFNLDESNASLGVIVASKKREAVSAGQVVAAIAIAVVLLVTGAFHEDAVADYFDAFGGGWTKDDILRILKDSRVGSYGATALIIALALRILAIASLDGIFFQIVAI